MYGTKSQRWKGNTTSVDKKIVVEMFGYSINKNSIKVPKVFKTSLENFGD